MAFGKAGVSEAGCVVVTTATVGVSTVGVAFRGAASVAGKIGAQAARIKFHRRIVRIILGILD